MGIAVVACTSLVVVSSGVAPAAPDLIGKQYGEAKGLLGQSGLRLVARIFRAPGVATHPQPPP
jgi:beta-lactam-binding protein with PASTA domain